MPGRGQTSVELFLTLHLPYGNLSCSVKRLAPCSHAYTVVSMTKTHRGTRLYEVPYLIKHVRYPERDGSLAVTSKNTIEWVCFEHEKEFYQSCTVYNKYAKGWSCPGCWGGEVVPGETDMWTTHPELARQLLNESDGYLYKAGTSKILWWQCSNDPSHASWKASGDNRKGRATHRPSGCPTCNHGVNLTAPTFFYIHDSMEKSTNRPVLKFGITGNLKDNRIENGYTLLKVLLKTLLNTGYEAQELEDHCRQELTFSRASKAGELSVRESFYTDSKSSQLLRMELIDFARAHGDVKVLSK